jgi:hypothetical protein
VNPFKEPEMNKRMIWILSAALLSGVSVAAIASNHGMERHEGQRSHGKNAGVKGTEAQLARLESALKLEDAQRPAWQAFAKDIQAVAQAREQQRQSMRQAMKEQQGKAGATERLDAMGQMMQAQQAHLVTLKQATQTLMAQLKPAQQAVFNVEAAGLMGGGHTAGKGRSGGDHDRGACKG